AGSVIELRNSRTRAAGQQLQAAVKLILACAHDTDGPELGELLILIREAGIDPLEAAFATGVRRFDKSGEYAADGALSVTAWLKWKCKLSGGAAAERVEIGKQLERLPKTDAAFARGDLGYQHVAVMARTAENLGAAAVRSEEGNLLTAAQSMDPGQFTTVVKNFEHRVDAAAALAEANRAYERRYLHISDPHDGLVRIDGLLDAENGAIVKARLAGLMKPIKDDYRTHGQRCADALVEACRQGSGKGDSSGPRPQLIIRASLDTLAGIPGAAAGELEGGGTVPAETVQRHACDSAITRLTGQSELEHELNHAVRTLPASTRRALEARDRHCVWPGCARPLSWCDGHHLVWWIRGGETSLPNLALLCRPHHRLVHEGGWSLLRQRTAWHATPPGDNATRHAPRRE
ncbi:MAG TPA: DUF222 domain-containing protein, partial [Candidatus Dormibacteraeota bacterium]|nr:DUF222 domain-containing protein [Candidatus Dormibacteraeota bacterium]